VSGSRQGRAPVPEPGKNRAPMRRSLSVLAVGSIGLLAAGGLSCGGKAGSARWVSAYFRADRQTSVLAASDIDYGAVTHVIHFSVRPNADGSVDTSVVSPALSSDAVGAAHAAGRKILLCVGGSNSAPGFGPAIGAAVRPALISNLVALVAQRGYDGLDLDFEPLTSTWAADFAAFVGDLRAALDAKGAMLLTAAPGTDATQPPLFASLADKLDQINIQTYNLSGTSTGVTWYNGALYDGGRTGPTGVPLPSCEGKLATFLAAGIPAAKLGLGIDFAGKVWAGATGPDQGLSGVLPPQPITYAQIMDTLFSPAVYQWDAAAEVPFLGIAGPAAQFVSYDDETSCPKKVVYARQKGLGGVMIWELSAGYRTSQPPGQRDALLQSIKKEL
jgi:chitinase